MDLETVKKESMFIRNIRNHLYSKTFWLLLFKNLQTYEIGSFFERKYSFYWIYNRKQPKNF